MQGGFTGFPEALRAMRCWTVWKYEPRTGGKPAKVPYDVRDGKARYQVIENREGTGRPLSAFPAKSNRAETWGTFEGVHSQNMIFFS